MAVRTNAWLKANFLERDSQEYMDDLLDTFGPAVWQNAVTKVYVDSTSAAASDSNAGTDPAAPLATLDAAFGVSGLAAGDIIYVMPGHAETYSTTGAKVTLDVAGVYVVGVGTGASRPTFTFGHTGATWTWSAAGVTVFNCLFVTSVDSVTTFATISGADAHLLNCETRDVTDKEVVTDFTITGDRPVIDGLFKNGYTGGNANDCVLSLNGVDRAEIKNCRFITNCLTAIIEFVSNASTAVEIHTCDFLETGTTNYSKNVVDTITGSTWAVWDCFDLGAGSTFSGGSGAAVASDDVGTAYTNLTSSATSVGTTVGSIQTNLTSSATSVATAVGSIQTNLTSSATSVATGVDSVQTNLTSSATSVATAVGSIQTNLTSSATSIGTDMASNWASWETEWSVQASLIMSGVASV